MDRSGRVKRTAILTAALLFAVTSFIYSEGKGIGFSTFIDLSWVFPVGLAVHPGAEFTFYSFDLNDNMTLALGAAATGEVAFAKRVDQNKDDLWSYTTFGIAIAPIATLSFERISFSLSPGIGFNYYIYAGDPAYYANRDTFIIGFSGIAGGRFSINRFITLRLNAMYWGKYIGPNIALGIQLDLW
jgi:hypothetical protein